MVRSLLLGIITCILCYYLVHKRNKDEKKPFCKSLQWRLIAKKKKNMGKLLARIQQTLNFCTVDTCLYEFLHVRFRLALIVQPPLYP